MKTIYKLMIFLAIFQLVPLMINSLGVFPDVYVFYSDVDQAPAIENVPYTYNYSGAEQIFYTLFTPKENQYFSSASITVILATFIGVGSVVAVFTKNYVLIPLLFQGYMVTVMLSKSMNFFGKLFGNWDSMALLYLGLIFGVCVVILIVITMMETVTHGDV